MINIIYWIDYKNIMLKQSIDNMLLMKIKFTKISRFINY